MRFGCFFIVPSGLVILLIMGLPAIFDPDGQPNPDAIILNSESSYQNKAKDYAELDRRQEALDTCASMEDIHSNSAQEICLLDVYDELDDIDGKNSIYEKWLANALADGDSGVAESHVLDGLKEEKRDKKR